MKWLPILPSQRLMFNRLTAQILAWKSNLQREENRSTQRKTLGVRLRSTNLSPHADSIPGRRGGRHDWWPLRQPDSPTWLIWERIGTPFKTILLFSLHTLYLCKIIHLKCDARKWSTFSINSKVLSNVLKGAYYSKSREFRNTSNAVSTLERTACSLQPRDFWNEIPRKVVNHQNAGIAIVCTLVKWY